MVTVDDRLDKIEKKITDNLIPEKEWEPPKRCIFCRGYDFQKKVFTNMASEVTNRGILKEKKID